MTKNNVTQILTNFDSYLRHTVGDSICSVIIAID